jgi:2-polyprenyl-3-methyl-5-hydroxy-6-metoxy-1,4-benzoquinol methylase
MADAQAIPDERFAFGENWSRFLRIVNPDRITAAERSLLEMLALSTLEGKTFLDIGCGSGLFSLAAARLGARVHSLDYDIKSVRCAEELRRRFAPPTNWTIEQGSALDRAYLSSLGNWDIVYSWGVLHHTGNMWAAIANVVPLVKPDGKLFISIYNDQGFRSKAWAAEKRLYVHRPWLRPFLIIGVGAMLVSYGAVVDVFGGRAPWARYQNKERGMNWYYDLLDWLGGYPFEVASPRAIEDYLGGHGFRLERKITRTSSGCNEFVFVAPSQPPTK